MSKEAHGMRSVVNAMALNTCISIAKFIAFFSTGSAAMFSEAVHSAADTANQGLLLVGIKRSLKGETEQHCYGHGQERFYWALVSACGIFFVGAGITIYHGIHALILGETAENGLVNILVLAGSTVAEFRSFAVALSESHEGNPDKTIWQSIKSGDPTILAVLWEDGVAIVGNIIALLCIALAKITGLAWLDSICSIIIGLLLAGVAIKLANINRVYLIEKAMPVELRNKLKRILGAFESILLVEEIKSSAMDTSAYRVKCKVIFNGTFLEKEHQDIPLHMSPGIIRDEIEKIKDTIRDEMPEICYLTIEI